ncbi:hypothetical protein HY628_01125 [Candidatus Uhrbacteria bacterium]|nr:hypothetical protein [Candidatus Uhrbacteria bacterium]
MRNRASITILGAAGLALASLFWFKTPLAGVLSLIIFLAVNASLLGERLRPQDSRTSQTVFGLLGVLAIAAISGAFFLGFTSLGTVSAVLTIIIITLISLLVRSRKPAPPLTILSSIAPSRSLTLLAWMAFLIPSAIILRMLQSSATTISIRSPWEVLPPYFFIAIFAAAGALFLMALFRIRGTLLAATIFSILAASIPLFIYPLGYGFDPLVHQATETYIAANGLINPTPFPYLGFYGLIQFLHQISHLSVITIDRLLLPLLLSLLPIIGLVAFRSRLVAILLPFIPFTTFAATTPQGVANVFALFTALVIMASQNLPLRKSIIPLGLLGIATALFHPLSGVLALFMTGAWLLLSQRKKIFPALLFPLALLSSLSLPLLFIAFGKLRGLPSLFQINPEKIIDTLVSLVSSSGAFDQRYQMTIDFAHLFGRNITLLIAGGAAITFWLLVRREKKRWPVILALTSLVAFFNGFFLLAFINFSFLPAHEQAGYGQRLFDMSLLLLVPLFLMGFDRVIRHLRERLSPFLLISLMMILAGLLTSRIYLTYPHHDAYTIERGWSVGQADIEAVRLIDQDAGGAPFIVLANQSMAAASLREFGFKTYFPFHQDDGATVAAFYYPIPTGGPLYQYFLRMSYDSPSAKVMAEAMERTGVKLGYFVVNRYWWKSEKLVEQTKQEAEAWWSIEDGAVHVFRFKKESITPNRPYTF